jgi:hypothetical protein
MKNKVRNVGERGHEDSLGILLFLLGRPLVFALGIYVGVLLRESGYDSFLFVFLCMAPTITIEVMCTSKIKAKIKKQKQLYSFNPSDDISWNIEKHKEYEKIRKSELKWWEFWL